MAKCLPLSHAPPDEMFPADEYYGNAALPGTLLAHLALSALEENFPLGIPIRGEFLLDRGVRGRKNPARVNRSGHIARRHRLRHDPAGRGRSRAPLCEIAQELQEGPTQRALAVEDRKFREQNQF